MTDWQPIETAPRDGTVIDVWLEGCLEVDLKRYCGPEYRVAKNWMWIDGQWRPASDKDTRMSAFVQPTLWRSADLS